MPQIADRKSMARYICVDPRQKTNRLEMRQSTRIRNKILQSFTVNPGRRIASGYFESCAESGRKLYR